MIPRIIHQTYKTTDLPWFFKKGQDSAKRHMPDWKYRFWTDEDLDRLVREDYPQFYERWLGLDKQIKRVDTARYMILHKHGGMYADLDFYFKKPVDELLQDENFRIYSYKTTQAIVNGWEFFGNAWLSSETGESFWIELLEWIFSNPSCNHVLFHTGPRALGYFYDSDTFSGVKIFGPDIFDNEKCADGVGLAEFGCHGRTGTWQRPDPPNPLPKIDDVP